MHGKNGNRLPYDNALNTDFWRNTVAGMNYNPAISYCRFECLNIYYAKHVLHSYTHGVLFLLLITGHELQPTLSQSLIRLNFYNHLHKLFPSTSKCSIFFFFISLVRSQHSFSFQNIIAL